MPDKIKADLTKINNFLKLKKIDVFEMFEKMDSEETGAVKKKQFATVLIREYTIPELTMERVGAVFDAID